MAIYANTNADAAIASVEFSPADKGNFAFFYLDATASKSEVKQWLAQAGQSIISETQVGGKLTLITRGHSQEQLLQLLASRGDTFQPMQKEKKAEPWVIRSLLGFGGQTLQLISSFMRPSGKLDYSIFGFAALNLTANTINLIYKGQVAPDPHQLRYLKQQSSDKLKSQLKPGEIPPDVDERSHITRDTPKRKRIESLDQFLQRHSVSVGELGMRYLGALCVAFPVRNLTPRAMREGRFLQMDPSIYRRYTGFASVAGKTVSLSSTIEDPYNPKPRSWLDALREKFTFVTGGLIEVTAYSALAYENFFRTNPNVAEQASKGIRFNGKIYRDWLGGIGASMFVLGYVVRSWAKFGKRRFDKNELYVHVSDTLAKVSPEKIPQLLSERAAELHEHFSKNNDDVDFGAIYSAIASDLEKHNGIKLEPATVQKTAGSQATNSGPQSRIDAATSAHSMMTQEKTEEKHTQLHG